MYFGSDVSRDKKRLKKERQIDCDTNRLYGPLQEAIKYLQEIQEKHPNCSLDEHWIGYEDMHMRFVWDEDETDEEYEARQKFVKELEDKEAEITRRDILRKQKKKQIEKLQRELAKI